MSNRDVVDEFKDKILKMRFYYITPPIKTGFFAKKHYCPKCKNPLKKFQYGSMVGDGGRWTLFQCSCGYEYGYRYIIDNGRDIHPKYPARATDVFHWKKTTPK